MIFYCETVSISSYIILLIVAGISFSRSELCPRQCRCDASRKTVYCMDKQLINLPLGIPTGTKRLLLQNNRLVNSPDLDSILSTLTSLEKLELSNNTLTAFPKNMPPTVTWISMKENTIKFIGRNSLNGLGLLRTLYLDNNMITNQGLSSTAFIGAVALETLSLQGNHLTRIPTGLPSSIRHLHFSRNKISSVATNAIDHMKDLISLDLNRNMLTSSSIQDGALKLLPNLDFLDLSHNLLHSVPPNLSPNITQLILSHNRISMISASIFTERSTKSLNGMMSLRHLDLSFNRLKNVETGSFSSLISLKTVILHDNPWQCDCHLRYVKNWLMETTALVTMESNTVCFTPTVIQGVTLASLDQESLKCFPEQIPGVNTSASSNGLVVSWLIADGTNPSYAEYRLVCGELICENCSQQEIIADVNRGEHSYVTSIVGSYDIFPMDYTHVKEGIASIDVPNLKANKLYIVCLLNAYDKVSDRRVEDCNFVKTKTLPATTTIPKPQDESLLLPMWLIVVVSVFVVLVIVAIIVVVICWRSVNKKQYWKRRCRQEPSPMTYDPFRQIYTMPDSRREMVYDQALVGGVNISNYREGNLSATKDAGSEFNVTLMINPNSNSNPNLLALHTETCESYCSDSHEDTLSTNHTRTNTSASMHSDRIPSPHRQSGIISSEEIIL